MQAAKHRVLVLVCMLLATACKLNRNYSVKQARNVSQLEEPVEVNALAYHINDSITEIHVELKNDNLLYKRPDTSSAFYADVKIHFNLLPEAGSKKLLDSSSFNLIDRSETESIHPKSLRTKFLVKIKTGSNCFVELEALDRNKKTKYESNLDILKEKQLSQQNFLASVNDTLSFKNYFAGGQTVLVKFRSPVLRQIRIDCFFREFGAAPPPFSVKPPDENKYRPDSSYTMDLSTNQFVLKMPQHGFYHVKSSEGEALLNLFTFSTTYPSLGNSDEMINSTRYIMERTEYENCKEAPEQKTAIDNFWLTIGGSNERARELLKRYYGRVAEANRAFTSYAQGWKSDRGMIFIVFGPPTNIYKSKKDEIWVYGNEANPAALRFVFNKTQNPYSSNDFVLERSQFYKDAWYSAVEYWRQGNIYLDNKR